MFVLFINMVGMLILMANMTNFVVKLLTIDFNIKGSMLEHICLRFGYFKILLVTQVQLEFTRR